MKILQHHLTETDKPTRLGYEVVFDESDYWFDKQLTTEEQELLGREIYDRVSANMRESQIMGWIEEGSKG